MSLSFPRRPAVSLLLTGVACLSLAMGLGCGSREDEFRKELRAINDRLVALQNGHDRLEERVATMEATGHVARNAPAAPSPSTVTRPPLRVVKLTPEGSSPSTPPPLPSGTAAEPLERVPANPAPSGRTQPKPPRTVIRGTGNNITRTMPEERR